MQFHRPRPSCLHTIATRIAIAVVLTGSAIHADDYYVDGRTGTDSQAAGSQANPWKTIRYALAQIAAQPRKVQTLFVAGQQAYAIASPITLPDLVNLVGTGSSRPLFVIPSSARVGLRSGPTAATYTGGVHSIDFLGGSTAIEVLPPAGAKHLLTIEDCRFTKQATRAIDVGGYSGTINVVRCSFVDQTNGIRAQTTQSSVTCEVLHGDFERVTGTAIEIAVGGSARIYARFVDSRFDTCASAIASSANTTDSTHLSVDHCAFRQISGAAIVANAIGGTHHQLVFASSTFTNVPKAIAFDGTRASGIVRFQVGRNVILGASKVGIDLQIGGLPNDLPTWFAITGGNIFERCAEGLVVRVGQTALGDFTSDSDAVRFSKMDAMRFECSAMTFQTYLYNAMLTGNQGRALTVRSSSPFDGRFLTIADNAGTALDVGTSPVTLDHALLDNNKSPELAGGSRLTVSYSCSRITRFPGTGNFVADPKLTRPSYKLTSASPCIDAGDPTADTNVLPYFDYEGKRRVLMTTRLVFDIGADEFRARGSIANFGADAFGVVSTTRPVFSRWLGESVIGGSFQLGAMCARSPSGQAMTGAIFLLGDADGAFVADLDPLGFAGSMLYFAPRAVSPFSSCSQGVAWLSVQVPNQQQLVDAVVAFQALLAIPGANGLGLVSSGGMRVRVGK